MYVYYYFAAYISKQDTFICVLSFCHILSFSIRVTQTALTSIIFILFQPNLLDITRWPLWQIVRELGIAERTGFLDITNEQLDDIVRAFMNIQGSFVGYLMVQGHLRNMGITILRERIRSSIARVDPSNCRLRWATVVSRRTYSVAGPNSLWHIDGHHSLITWGFVIHGGIDGYSQLICFLKCSTNNRKETVEMLFLQSVQKYSWPSIVRSDYRGKNILVNISLLWEAIIEHLFWLAVPPITKAWNVYGDMCLGVLEMYFIIPFSQCKNMVCLIFPTHYTCSFFTMCTFQ